MRRSIAVLVLAAGFFAACGTVEPQGDDAVVVEAFMSPGAIEAEVTVRHSQVLSGSMEGQNPVDDANVRIRVGSEESFADRTSEGRYVAALEAPLEPDAEVMLNVDWRGERAQATTRIPRPVRIDSFEVNPARRPVEAVMIDSLQIGAPAPETGWVYLVDVSLWWQHEAVGEESYIRARLKPEQSFVGPVVDFFLRSDHIFPEMTAASQGTHRRWDGVYAVRVESPDDSLPEHELALALLRSGRDYARYASSRIDADRREPTGNVVGGIGIVAGVAVDSMRVVVIPMKNE
jgi:hypothetical protein